METYSFTNVGSLHYCNHHFRWALPIGSMLNQLEPGLERNRKELPNQGGSSWQGWSSGEAPGAIVGGEGKPYLSEQHVARGISGLPGRTGGQGRKAVAG